MMKTPKNKRNLGTSSVGEAINDLLDNYNLKEKFNQKRIIDSWGSLMGNTIASRTSKIFIKNKVLFIELSSAPLKNELVMSKAKIISIFDNEVGKGIVEDIVFL